MDGAEPITNNTASPEVRRKWSMFKLARTNSGDEPGSSSSSSGGSSLPKRRSVKAKKSGSEWSLVRKATREKREPERESRERNTHPDWNLAFASGVASLKLFLQLCNTESVDAAAFRRIRRVIDLGAAPSHPFTRIAREHIPRLDALRLAGMAPPDAAGLIRAEWVSFPADAADAADAERVILFVHGGAYCLCSRKTHRWASWKLAKDARCRVLVFDYRLAPEHVFPLALHDCISAYSFLINPPPYSGLKKYDPKNVVVMGDSAGGGLALAMMLWIRDHGSGSLAAQQQNQSSDAFDASYLKMPAGVGLLSPWLDLTQSMPSFRINGKYDYLPDKTKDKILNENRSHYYVKDNSFLKNPLVSPYWATESETQPLPPILVQIGEYERLRDENLAFATKRFTTTPLQLEMYDAMIHVFQIFNMVYPLSDLAMQRLAAFAIRVTDPAFRVEDYERKMTRFGSGEGFPTSEITMDLVETYLSAKREDEIEKVEEKEEQELTETVKQMNAKMSELILNGALTVDPEDESSDDLEEDVV